MENQDDATWNQFAGPYRILRLITEKKDRRQIRAIWLVFPHAAGEEGQTGSMLYETDKTTLKPHDHD